MKKTSEINYMSSNSASPPHPGSGGHGGGTGPLVTDIPHIDNNGEGVYEGVEGEGQIIDNEPGLMATNAFDHDVNVDDILKNLEENSNEKNKMKPEIQALPKQNVGDVDVDKENEKEYVSQIDSEIQDQFGRHLSDQVFIEKDVVMNDIVEDMETVG